MGRFAQKLSRIGGILDTASLQLRLAAGMAFVMAVSLGGVAFWTGWQMQKSLGQAQQQAHQTVASRVNQALADAQQRMPIAPAVQWAMTEAMIPSTAVVWVKRADGTVWMQSNALVSSHHPTLAARLLAIATPLPQPRMVQFEDQAWMVSSTPLLVQGATIGQLYTAQNVTSMGGMVQSTLRYLTIGSGVAVLLGAGITLLYVRRSLNPLRQLNRLAGSQTEPQPLHLQQTPTEVKDLVQEWNGILDDLSAMREKQRHCIHHISHELRTPLTIVSGYLQSLQRRSQNLTDAQQEALTAATTETDRTIQLLQDLLDLARASNRSLPLHYESVNLQELAREVTAQLGSDSQRVKPRHSEIANLAVQVDRTRLKQILTILVNDALHRLGPTQSVGLGLWWNQGQLTIQVGALQPSPVKITAAPLPPTAFDWASEMPYRTAHSGGLGLALVEALVIEMGGTIAACKDSSQPWIFALTLPAQLDTTERHP